MFVTGDRTNVEVTGSLFHPFIQSAFPDDAMLFRTMMDPSEWMLIRYSVTLVEEPGTGNRRVDPDELQR